jgi:hypothetical protein
MKLSAGDGVQATFAVSHVLRADGEDAEVIAILTHPIGEQA